MTIRYFQKKDTEHVARLFDEIVAELPYYNDLAKQHEIERYSRDNILDKIEEDPKSIIVAETDDTIVGVCFSRFDDFTIWLEWILVDPKFQKHHVGTQLIDLLDKTSTERGCHKIWCDCRTSNAISKSFLQSVGFSIITTIENHWYKQDFVLLQKFLDV